MKSSFDLRPIYVSMENRIIGHCTLCVLALLVHRLLEDKLQQHQIAMTPDDIRKALKNAYVLPIINNGEVSYLNASHSARVKARNSASLSLKTASYDDLKALLKEKKSADIDMIMKSVGLTPLGAACSRTALCKCIGRRYVTDKEIIGLSYHK